jgi:hypothetical protein
MRRWEILGLHTAFLCQPQPILGIVSETLSR